MRIETGRRVRIKVELTVVGGALLEKSTLEYIQGGGTMLPGLEAVLAGADAGTRKTGVLRARDAFGNPALQPIKKMGRGEFPRGTDLRIGERFAANDGAMNVILEVVAEDANTVDVRLVHPLANKDIQYDVTVVTVTNPLPPPMPAAAIDLKDE